jgi:hypothetical protein
MLVTSLIDLADSCQDVDGDEVVDDEGRKVMMGRGGCITKELTCQAVVVNKQLMISTDLLDLIVHLWRWGLPLDKVD